MNPPWPGIRLLESLILALLFIKLNETSPIKLTGVIIRPNKIAPDNLMSTKPDINPRKIGVEIDAPIKPSSVLPGLVFLRRILFPNFFPKKYALESAKDTAIRIKINNMHACP